MVKGLDSSYFVLLLLQYIFSFVVFQLQFCNGDLKSSSNSTVLLASFSLNSTMRMPILEKAESELLNKSLSSKLDKVFSVDGGIFEEYLKDLIFLPGLRKDDDFENWTPSEGIEKDMPFYMSGFDYMNRPIWVLSVGKYDFIKYGHGGKKLQAEFNKYWRYVFYNTLKSLALKNSKELPVNQYNFFIDFEGLRPEIVVSPKALQFMLKWISDYRRFGEKYFAKVVILNVNSVSELVLNLIRYLIFRNLDKTTIYGTNKAWWVRQLLQNYPMDQIPEKYGGSKGFKPLYAFG